MHTVSLMTEHHIFVWDQPNVLLLSALLWLCTCWEAFWTPEARYIHNTTHVEQLDVIPSQK